MIFDKLTLLFVEGRSKNTNVLLKGRMCVKYRTHENQIKQVLLYLIELPVKFCHILVSVYGYIIM